MITSEYFGTTKDGQEVLRYTLTNQSGMTVTALSYGCTIQRIIVPDKNGAPVDVALGYEDLRSYEEGWSFFGAVVGRFASSQAMAAVGSVGAGPALLAAAKSESRVRFDALRSIRVLRRYSTIKVNERLEHCQVYAAPEDFDFVLDFILAHAPDGVRIRR